MNWVDLIVLAIILISAFMALTNGFIQEILLLAAWVFAILVTIYHGQQIRPLINDYVTNDLAARFTSWGITFFVSLVVAMIIVKLLSRGLRGKGLGFVDHLMGFIFGTIRGVIIVCLLYGLTLWLIPSQDRPWLETARTAPLMKTTLIWIQSLLPADIAGQLLPNFETNQEDVTPSKPTTPQNNVAPPTP
ncbi:MAG: CvpA family protein [Alphaproteobacteria bacterium]|nr:CvpA family protein [Alphaproteobacteria bacterium]